MGDPGVAVRRTYRTMGGGGVSLEIWEEPGIGLRVLAGEERLSETIARRSGGHMLLSDLDTEAISCHMVSVEQQRGNIRGW